MGSGVGETKTSPTFNKHCICSHNEGCVTVHLFSSLIVKERAVKDIRKLPLKEDIAKIPHIGSHRKNSGNTVSLLLVEIQSLLK